MQEIKDTDTKPTPPKKPLIFYYIIAMIVVMLLNALLFPSMLEQQVIEVPYNEFLSMVDEGQVTQVALNEEERQLVFIAGEDEDSLRIYKTGMWPDDGQRLLQQLRDDPDIEFSAEIPLTPVRTPLESTVKTIASGPFCSHLAYSVCASVTSYGNSTLLTNPLSLYQPRKVNPSLTVTGSVSMRDTVMSPTDVPPFVSNCTV